MDYQDRKPKVPRCQTHCVPSCFEHSCVIADRELQPSCPLRSVPLGCCRQICYCRCPPFNLAYRPSLQPFAGTGIGRPAPTWMASGSVLGCLGLFSFLWKPAAVLAFGALAGLF